MWLTLFKEGSYAFSAIFGGLEEQGQIGLEPKGLLEVHGKTAPDGFLRQLDRDGSTRSDDSSEPGSLGQRLACPGGNGHQTGMERFPGGNGRSQPGCTKDFQPLPCVADGGPGHVDLARFAAGADVAGERESERDSCQAAFKDEDEWERESFEPEEIAVVVHGTRGGGLDRMDDDEVDIRVIPQRFELLAQVRRRRGIGSGEKGPATASRGFGGHCPRLAARRGGRDVASVAPSRHHGLQIRTHSATIRASRNAMANLTAPMPMEAEKTPWVHDRARIPARPATTNRDLLVRYQGLLLGLALALGFMVLAFQTRATWTTHRDWVVPMTVPFWAGAGVALGHLIDRRMWREAAPGLVLLAVAIGLTGVNDVRGMQVDGSDGLRDALSIITGTVCGLMIAALLGALVWVEMKNQTKAAPPAA